MFNQEEIQSAASAIAAAYKLCNCAYTTQVFPGSTQKSIFQCEAILLQFNCYYQDGQVHFFETEQTQEAFTGGLVKLPAKPAQTIKLLPVSKDVSIDVSEEKQLISQIELALISTIEQMSNDSTGQTYTSSQKLQSASKRSNVQLDSATEEETPPAASNRKLRCLQEPSPLPMHRQASTLKTRVLERWTPVLVDAVERIFAKEEIKQIPYLDRFASWCFEAGLDALSLQFHKRSLSLKHNWMGRRHTGRAANLEAVAHINWDSGDLESAEADLLEAIILRETILRKEFGSATKLSHKEEKACRQALLKTVETMIDLAQVYMEKGSRIEASHQLKRALQLLHSASIPFCQSLNDTGKRARMIYRSLQPKNKKRKREIA